MNKFSCYLNLLTFRYEQVSCCLSLPTEGFSIKVDSIQNGDKNSLARLSWVKVFWIIPEFRILRLTFQRKSAS